MWARRDRKRYLWISCVEKKKKSYVFWVHICVWISGATHCSMMQSPGTQDVGPMRPLGTISALFMPVPGEMMPPGWGDSRVWWGVAKEGDLHWRGSIPTDVPETPDYDPAPYNDVWLSQLVLAMTDESLHHLSLHALDEASANYLSHQLLLHTALPGCVPIVLSSPVLCNICPQSYLPGSLLLCSLPI